ncbi:MAG: NADH:ubiquinone reductase (Na(+)-transporting) subunit C, partial [Bacteroidales bacterium]|nr:NADH:ubiquinone reductase (Na(+)-transporting) subunit C [Bacteroidales bacterium]
YNTYIIEGVVVDVNGNIVPGKEAFDIDMDVELKKAKENMQLPVFKAKTDTGKYLYIVPVRGTGLWGPIWGYLSFESDMNTVYGVMFDHESETPGLGAELNTTDFESRFAGKTIFDDDKFVSIGVVKANVSRDEAHNVDAISGGTMTSLGVASMIDNCLSLYLPYLEANRK